MARPDGTLYGEGQGVVLTGEGDTLTIRGIGTGSFRGGGAVGYRGWVIHHATSQKLARLNSVAGAFEFEVDAERRNRDSLDPCQVLGQYRHQV